jgi:hypothetical protein
VARRHEGAKLASARPSPGKLLFAGPIENLKTNANSNTRKPKHSNTQILKHSIMVNLVDVFADFKTGKNIDRPTMVRVLEDVFRTLIKKKYGTDENFDVIVNTNTGDLEIWRVREVVPDGEVTN